MFYLSYETIYYINLPLCIISAIVNLLIFVAYVYLRELRIYTFRLVFYLSISELLTASAFMLPSWQSDSLCLSQAMILNFSCLSSVLWTNVIAFTIYRSVVLESTDGWKYELYYLLYAFGIPLSLNFLPLLTSSFGMAEGWCWITIEGGSFIKTFIGGNFWRVINYLAPLWFVICSNFYLYWKILRKIRIMIDNVTDGEFQSIMLYNRLKLYPFMLVMCHLPVTVLRVLGFFDVVTEQQVWLISLLSSFFVILGGVLNAVVYGLTDRVKQELQKIMYNSSESSGDTPLVISEGSDESINTY